MAFVSFGSRMYVPRPPIGALNAAPAFVTSMLLDAAGEKAQFICDAPKTGNIRKIHWATRACTITGSIDLTIGIETIDRTAAPAVGSGTPWGTDTNAVQALTSADDNVTYATTLTADAAVVQGDPICVHWTAPGSGTFSVQIAALTTNLVDAVAYPYSILNGIYTPRLMAFALEYDDASIVPIPGARPISAATTTAFASGSSPNSIGERFQLTGPLRSIGFWLLADTDDTFNAKLVSTAYHRANATGILASRTVNANDRAANGAGRYQEWLWTAAVELSASTNYRWVIEPGATGITIYDYNVNSLALLDAIPGGQTWHLSTAANPTGDGDWTNYNSGTFRRIWGGLIFDGISDGAGGAGSMMRPVGMRGGLI